MTSMLKAFKVLGIYDDLLRVMTPQQIEALAGLPFADARQVLEDKLDEARVDVERQAVWTVLRQAGLH